MMSAGITGEQLLSEIGEIYEAALEPSRWESFLNLIAQRYPGAGVYLWLEDKERADVSVSFGVGSDPSFLRDYEAHFASVNPWTAAAQSRPVGDAHTGDMLIPQRQFLKSEFFNDWLKPQSLRDAFGVNVLRNDRHTFFFSVCLGEHQDARPHDLVMMKRLLPHLQRAAHLYGRFALLQQRCSVAEQLLDQVDVGVLVIDRERKPGFLNREAERVLRSGDGLAIVNQKLVAALPEENSRLDAEIDAGFDMASGKSLVRNGAVAVSRPSGSPAYIVYFVPLALGDKPSEFSLGLNLPAVAVFISDPEQRPTTPTLVLQKLYHFTPAEARLAEALINGGRIKTAADAFGITQETARSQLKTIFAKANVHSQAELVGRVLSDLAGMPLRTNDAD